MHMNRWRTVLALAVAGALLAGPVLAQSGSAPSGGAPKAGDKAPDAAKPGDSSAPSASPSTETQKSDTMKSDGMKSEGMKSDTMKAPGAKAGQAAVRGNREQIKAAQQALKDKGHDPGTVDGVMGPKTQAALKDFQKAQGLQETGRLDAETMAKLGVEGKTSQTDSSSPAASPQTAPGGSSSGPQTTPGGTGQDSGTAKDKQAPTGKPQTR
jgi:peptidoglycan hydrolase-like protein with peptidoglycan-binding domain